MQLTDKQKAELESIDPSVILEILDGFIDEIKDEAIDGTITLESAKTAIGKLRTLKDKFHTKKKSVGKDDFI